VKLPTRSVPYDGTNKNDSGVKRSKDTNDSSFRTQKTTTSSRKGIQQPRNVLKLDIAPEDFEETWNKKNTKENKSVINSIHIFDTSLNCRTLNPYHLKYLNSNPNLLTTQLA